jgi:hypothetical protein
MQSYRFEASGLAAEGQTWTVEGAFAHTSASISDVIPAARRLAFDKLTEGKAVFGQPGKACKGPYDITKIVIEKIYTNAVKP